MVVFSGLIIANPFYFMEDILYGNNDPQKDFGIYSIALGPGTADFYDWSNKVSDLFNLKIDELGEWPKSIRNHITLLGPEFPIITIKEKDFINFKNEIKKIRRSDEWFKQLDFLYLDASTNYINQTLRQIYNFTKIPSIE